MAKIQFFLDISASYRFLSFFVRITTNYKEAAKSNRSRAIVKAHSRDIARRKEIKLRKHLNADALFSTMKTGFDKIKDHRPCTIQHSLGDTLMSRFAMFSLKDPSLLAIDERRIKSPHNLMTI